MSTFEVLAGLPPYGPEALAFSATGLGTHSEGFVVRFVTDDRSDWVGNFQPGFTSCFAIVRHPNGHNYIVVAGGQAYIIDPCNPKSWEHFGASIEFVLEIKDVNGVLFGNGIAFEFIGSNGTRWKSRRISWDGMADLGV